MEAKQYCWVMCIGWSHHHSSLPLYATIGSWTIEGLTHQMPDVLNYRVGPNPGAPLSDWCDDLQSRTPARAGGEGSLCFWTPNNREGPQARDSSKRLNGQSCGERLAKEAFWSPVIRGLRTDSDRAVPPVAEAVSCRCTLGSARIPTSQTATPPSCSTLPQATCIYVCRVASLVSHSLWPCRLWPARLLCQGGGFSRQEYWSILANAGCHTPLEHYISCCTSHQLPWVPDAARTPATQAAAPPPHLDLTRANPSPPGQPQKQTPVDNPHAEVEIKPQLKPRGSVTTKKTQKLPTSCTSCRLNPPD